MEKMCMCSVSQPCRQLELPLLGRTFNLCGKELGAAVVTCLTQAASSGFSLLPGSPSLFQPPWLRLCLLQHSWGSRSWSRLCMCGAGPVSRVWDVLCVLGPGDSVGPCWAHAGCGGRPVKPCGRGAAWHSSVAASSLCPGELSCRSELTC